MNEITPEQLKALAQRIKSSGALGRSRTYADILDYLVECSIEGKSPKEMAIALDVLGRESDFDVAKDSIVRVHIYHLRNKLRAYYDKHGGKEPFRLDIPKGQYMLTALPNEPSAADEMVSETGRQLNRRNLTPWLAGLVAVLLLINLGVQFITGTADPGGAPEAQPLAGVGPWPAIYDDDTPILILVGDYYIFGETDGHGNVMRMVREFDVNSPEGLDFLKSEGIGENVGIDASNYINLDLGYIPTSTALALTEVMTALREVDPARIRVKMISEYTTADLAESHVIYLGYLSGLSDLHDLMFAASDLRIGGTYDELRNDKTGERFVSNSGLSVGDSGYYDYGMVSTFPAPNGNQVTMIAGMRDESLVSVAEQATNAEALRTLEGNVDATGEPAYEALYEVSGFNNTNFSSRMIYSKALDPSAVERLFGNRSVPGGR